jgi:hypothetical protein
MLKYLLKENKKNYMAYKYGISTKLYLVIYYIVGDRDFYYAPHGPAALVWRG